MEEKVILNQVKLYIEDDQNSITIGRGTTIECNSEITWLIYFRFNDEFVFPLTGSGDNHGKSVSVNIKLRSSCRHIFFISCDFLNVIIPEKERIGEGKTKFLAKNMFEK